MSRLYVFAVLFEVLEKRNTRLSDECLVNLHLQFKVVSLLVRHN
jgi:hypothetical protein